MTLDELIAMLEDARKKVGGTAHVVVVDARVNTMDVSDVTLIKYAHPTVVIS